MKKYYCAICGYEYDGEVSFEEVEGEYTCPVCGAEKEQFEEVDE